MPAFPADPSEDHEILCSSQALPFFFRGTQISLIYVHVEEDEALDNADLTAVHQICV